jgi:hypothetical protein
MNFATKTSLESKIDIPISRLTAAFRGKLEFKFQSSFRVTDIHIYSVVYKLKITLQLQLLLQFEKLNYFSFHLSLQFAIFSFTNIYSFKFYSIAELIMYSILKSVS